MSFQGNIRKMHSSLVDGVVHYSLPLYNNLEPNHLVPMNNFIGEMIKIEFGNQINCVVTGKRINKTYGEGMCYDAFKTSPLAVESIIRPELSRIHEGVALRDEEWERKHHLRPHYVYITKTAGLKVGVTNETQIPTRWIDQGAVEGLIIAKTPHRQAAGLIEVALKQYIADKTNWRKMLQNELTEDDIQVKKDELISYLDQDLKQYTIEDQPLKIEFPVILYPEKVKSLNFDKQPIVEGVLQGIKGQYLILDTGVINIRKFTAYNVQFSV